jgi:hypothetical protein
VEGEPCDRGCAGGLHCVEGRCRSLEAYRTHLAARQRELCEGNSACGEPPEPLTGCGPNGYCSGSRHCVAGACRDVAAPNEQCGEAVCTYGFTCQTGRCTPLPTLGAPCEPDLGCASGECMAGICTGRGPGEPCASPDVSPLSPCAQGQCIAGLCPQIAGEDELCDNQFVVCPIGTCVGRVSGAQRCRRAP